MSNKFEPWLAVERRTTDHNKETFCSLLEVQELRKEMEALKNLKTKKAEDRKGSGKQTGNVPTQEWNKYTKDQKEAHYAKQKKESDKRIISQMEVRNGEKFIKKGAKGKRIEFKVPCLYHKSQKQDAEACIRDTAHCYLHSVSIKEPWLSSNQPCGKCKPKE